MPPVGFESKTRHLYGKLHEPSRKMQDCEVIAPATLEVN